MFSQMMKQWQAKKHWTEKLIERERTKNWVPFGTKRSQSTRKKDQIHSPRDKQNPPSLPPLISNISFHEPHLHICNASYNSHVWKLYVATLMWMYMKKNRCKPKFPILGWCGAQFSSFTNHSNFFRTEIHGFPLLTFMKIPSQSISKLLKIVATWQIEGLLFLEFPTQAEATFANLTRALISSGRTSLGSKSSLILISLISGDAQFTSLPSSHNLPLKSSNKTIPNP